ncbi:MAG TPA: hypothetical protein VGB59_07235 [Allosphingosinicella sp.]|jgi:hypothetical protein
MGFIIEAIFDWIAVGIVDKLANRLPPWGCALLALAPAAAMGGLVWLAVR